MHLSAQVLECCNYQTQLSLKATAVAAVEDPAIQKCHHDQQKEQNNNQQLT